MRQKGVMAVIESLLAASIFLIFLINVLPSLLDTGSQPQVVEDRLFNTLKALDNGNTLRPLVLDKNLSGIQSQLENYFPTYTVAAGLSYSNVLEGDYTGGSHSQDFPVNKSQTEREILRVWIDSADQVVVEVNGENVIETSQPGYFERRIESQTTDGTNTLNITSNSGNLEYLVERYNYVQSRSLSTSGDIRATSYSLAGANTSFQPSEVRVFLWR